MLTAGMEGSDLERRDQNNRWRSFLLAFALAAVLLSLIMVGTVMAVQPTMPSNQPAQEQAPVSFRPPASDTLTLAVIGTSGTTAREFLLIRFNPQYGQVPLSLLPAESIVSLDGKRMSLAQAYEQGGGPAVKGAMSERFGIAVDRYACIDQDSFLRLAERVGSVVFELPYEIAYERNGYSILIPAGERRLDGKDILDLFAYPGFQEDPLEKSRILGQLVAAAVNQHLDAAGKDMSSSLFKLAVNLLDTDISYADYERRRDSADFVSKLDMDVAGALPADGIWLPQENGEALLEFSEDYTALVRQYFQASA